MKVLVVDDSSLARRTMRRMFEEMGHTVDDASDGIQALERYHLARHDLVILDMVMAGMDGLEVLAKMRELNPVVRIIIATADVQPSTRAQVMGAGAAGLVNKPVTKRAMTEAVAAALTKGDK